MPAECKICGSIPTGIHYGVLSCEACKAFFKRWMAKSVDYKCSFGNRCFDIEASQRYRCKACRFQRCLQFGMSLRCRKQQQNEPLADPSSPSSPSAQAQENSQSVSSQSIFFWPYATCHTPTSLILRNITGTAYSSVFYTPAKNYTPICTGSGLNGHGLKLKEQNSPVTLGSLVSFPQGVDPKISCHTQLKAHSIAVPSLQPSDLQQPRSLNLTVILRGGRV